MDLQTPEPEFGCRTPDSQTPEPESGRPDSGLADSGLPLDSGPPPTLLANRAMAGLRTLYSVFCHGGFERHRVRGAAGRGVSAPADVGAVSIRHAARRRGSSSQGAAGCPRRSRHRARGGSHRRTAAAAPPIGRRACDSAAGRATVPARHTQTQQQGVGGAAYAWRRYAFRVRARLAALSPARPRRLEPGPSEHDSTERAARCRLARRRKPSGSWRCSGRASQGRTPKVASRAAARTRARTPSWCGTFGTTSAAWIAAPCPTRRAARPCLSTESSVSFKQTPKFQSPEQRQKSWRLAKYYVAYVCHKNPDTKVTKELASSSPITSSFSTTHCLLLSQSLRNSFQRVPAGIRT